MDDDKRKRYEKGLPDYRDPTSGWGGAAPAYSALTLRLVLASFGLLVALGFTIWAVATGVSIGYIGFAVAIMVIAAINIFFVARRKVRGEPG